MSTAIAPKKPQIKTALPGPKGRAIVEADAKFVTPSYPRPSFKLVAERAKGVWVEDVDGNVFLDCNAGVAVCSTGHCHPEVVRAIQDQVAELIHMCGTDYYYRQMPDLAKKLDEIVPLSRPTRTHFANFDGLPWPTPYAGYSTPRDLLIMGKAAMKRPIFQAIVGQRSYTMRATATQ